MQQFTKYIAVSLVTAFLIGLVYQTSLVGHFYLNRDTIALNCENKDKPEKKCHGKCQLEKKLVAVTPIEIAEKQTSPALQFWLFGIEELPQFKLNFVEVSKCKVHSVKNILSEKSIELIVAPPELNV